jgi:hypothetical protein
LTLINQLPRFRRLTDSDLLHSAFPMEHLLRSMRGTVLGHSPHGQYKTDFVNTSPKAWL